MSNDQQHMLVPAFRNTGKYLLLLWHEHNSGHNILIAKNEKQLETMWKAVLKKKNWTVVPKELWDADIVLPPKEFAEAYAKNSYRHELSKFKNWLISLAHSYENTHGILPNGFKKCENYITEYQTSEFSKKRHLDCLTCESGRLIITLDIETLFESKKDRFRAETYTKYTKKVIPFVGQECDPTKKLFLVSACYGHHSTGIEISALENEKPSVYNPYLIFFHGTKLDMPPKYNQMKQEIIKWRADRDSQFKQRRQHEENMRHAKEAMIIKELLDGI